MTRPTSAAAIALLTAAVALANAPWTYGNAPPPRPPQKRGDNFIVEVDRNAADSKLIIPKKMVDGRVSLDSSTGDALAEAPRPLHHTVIAGSALALAFG